MARVSLTSRCVCRRRRLLTPPPLAIAMSRTLQLRSALDLSSRCAIQCFVYASVLPRPRDRAPAPRCVAPCIGTV
eukprot:129733-Pleurochrysis_carterae.AAC.2